MNLTDKQTAKLEELLKSVNFGDANTALNAADTTRYLPRFSEEMAYITTKKASSSVIRSA